MIPCMRKTLALMIVAIFGAGAAFYYYKTGATVEKRQKTAVVKRGEIVVTVSASGSVEPDFQVEVKSKA